MQCLFLSVCVCEGNPQPSFTHSSEICYIGNPILESVHLEVNYYYIAF